LEERESSIELQVLKARQLGVTTLVQALICHRIVFGYGVNAISGSADQQKTAIMANKMFLTYDMMPIWLKPEATGRSTTERGYLTFAQTKSGVSFQHGAQMSGIARGTTPTVYHLSECASFTNAKVQIENALFKAVHASPAIFGVLESTGEGDVGWWAETWKISKSEWKRNRSRLCPLFLPWFTATNLYPTPTWLRMRPIPEDWTPLPETRAHTAKSELFVRSNPLLAKQLGENFRLPREQQWWWEVEHEQAKMKGLEAGFLQEYCGDDEEALQRSATGVFGAQDIIELDSARSKAYEAFAIVGQSIEQDHEPSVEYIDYDKERIPVRYENQVKEEKYKWELVPLKFNPPLRETEAEDARGVFFIWHHPRPGVRYAVGCDTGEGLGQDATSISVWALGDNDAPDVQVAEYTSDYVNHVESFAFLIAICAYYKRHMSNESTRWREPYVSIEQLKAVGDVAQKQMAAMGYRNFHMFNRYDGKNPAQDKQRSRRRGWYSNSWSRPMLTGHFVTWAKNGWITINSPWLIEECKTYELVTKSGRTRMDHEEGAHDDRIMAAAMATFCPHDLDPMTIRSKKRLTEAEGMPRLDLRPVSSNSFSYKDLQQREVASLSDIVDSMELERFR